MLALEALPGDLHASIASSKPSGHRKPRVVDGEATSETLERERRTALRAARLARGPVRIAELYDGGLYEREVVPWMQMTRLGFRQSHLDAGDETMQPFRPSFALALFKQKGLGME